MEETPSYKVYTRKRLQLLSPNLQAVYIDRSPLQLAEVSHDCSRTCGRPISFSCEIVMVLCILVQDAAEDDVHLCTNPTEEFPPDPNSRSEESNSLFDVEWLYARPPLTVTPSSPLADASPPERPSEDPPVNASPPPADALPSPMDATSFTADALPRGSAGGGAGHPPLSTEGPEVDAPPAPVLLMAPADASPSPVDASSSPDPPEGASKYLLNLHPPENRIDCGYSDFGDVGPPLCFV